jgi:ABC transporter with metal-binding/Fe-S-binding domain ATP-binding protein
MNLSDNIEFRGITLYNYIFIILIMQLGALFSGGKDSVFSIFKALNLGHNIKCLITIISKNPESYMYHVPNIELTELHSESMEIPIIIRQTDGVKEEELIDLKIALQTAKEKYNIKGIVSGAIYSNYQRQRIEKICNELGLVSLVPLWKQLPKDMLLEMVDNGFVLIMSAVAAGGLGPEWLGKQIDRDAIIKLSKLHETCYVCTGGEGGEFETFVIDAPIFKKRLEIIESEPVWDGQAGVYKIKKVTLINKKDM